MKTNEQTKQTIRVTEGPPPDDSKESLDAGSKPVLERFKKPLIYTLMSVAFIGCLYMIFGPGRKDQSEMPGLNDTVPVASGSSLQADKQKAYELDMLEQKEQQKRTSLMSLADYLGTEKAGEQSGDDTLSSDNLSNQSSGGNPNAALTSYQNIQHSVGSFYERNDGEAEGLKMEVMELKRQLAEKSEPTADPVATHTALMEKSFEMASRYLPNVVQQNSPSKDTVAKEPVKEKGAPLLSTPRSVVSGLYRQQSDEAFMESWTENRNMRFFTAGQEDLGSINRNSIAACIHEDQTITENVAVRIRLLQPARIKGVTIPEGSLITAISKFQGNRLQLIITSVEYSGNIIPAEVIAYDTDGQAGLHIPYSPERNAITEVVANMGNTAGTNISMSATTGQQIASDMSRSLVQGVSGYLSKKVRTPKVTVKAGHRLLLVSQKIK